MFFAPAPTPGSAPLQPSLLAQRQEEMKHDADDQEEMTNDADDQEEEMAMTRTPFPYWEYEARYAAQFEARHPGEELPRNDWVIRFGDRDAKLHHRLKSPPGSVDASRWDFENSLLYATQFSASTYIVMKNIESSFEVSYAWDPPRAVEPASVNVDVNISADEWVVVDVEPLGLPVQQTDNMILPLGGTRSTTRRVSPETTMFWCWESIVQPGGVSSIAKLDEQVEERLSSAGMLTNLASVVVSTGNIHKTSSLLSGVGHRAIEKEVMAREDRAGLRAPVGRPRGQRITDVPSGGGRGSSSGDGSALTIEESRFREMLRALPGPQPLPASMIEMIIPARDRKLSYFKLPEAMWSVVCLRIDAKKGGWAKHQPQAALKEAIAFVEDNFPELVPRGKLQLQTVAKHYLNWKRPPILDAKGRRGYLPASAMVAVIAAVRGAMRYPIEMNARLLRPVIKGTLVNVDAGIHKKYLKDYGGYFTISSDWINTLCRKLKMPYKRATTHSTHVPNNADDLHALFILKIALFHDTYNIPDELFINADHAGVMLLNTKGYGRCEQGGEVASVSHASAEKRQFTLLPVVAASGDVPKWQCIFEGATEACLPPKHVRDKYPNLYFSYSNNHWANMNTTKQFTYEMFDYYEAYVARVGEDPETTTLRLGLLIDCWKVWKSSEYIDWVKVTFNNKIKIRFIDARMTGREQPLDVLLQAFIKNTITGACEDHMLTSVQEQLGYGIPPGGIRLDLSLAGLKEPYVSWLNLAHERLTARPDFVRKAFDMAKISSAAVRDPATVLEAHRAASAGRLYATANSDIDEDDDVHMEPNEPGEPGNAEDAEVGMNVVDEIMGIDEVADDARAQPKDHLSDLSPTQELLGKLAEGKMQVAEMKSLLKDLKQKQSGVKQELKTRLKGALEDKLTTERKAQPKRASEPAEEKKEGAAAAEPAATKASPEPAAPAGGEMEDDEQPAPQPPPIGGTEVLTTLAHHVQYGEPIPFEMFAAGMRAGMPPQLASRCAPLIAVPPLPMPMPPPPPLPSSPPRPAPATQPPPAAAATAEAEDARSEARSRVSNAVHAEEEKQQAQRSATRAEQHQRQREFDRCSQEHAQEEVDVPIPDDMLISRLRHSSPTRWRGA